MLRVSSDPEADAVYIYLIDNELVGYTQELDDNRLIDRAPDGQAIGIDLMLVSKGVKLEGLPEAETVEKILTGLGVSIIKEAKK